LDESLDAVEDLLLVLIQQHHAIKAPCSCEDPHIRAPQQRLACKHLRSLTRVRALVDLGLVFIDQAVAPSQGLLNLANLVLTNGKILDGEVGEFLSTLHRIPHLHNDSMHNYRSCESGTNTAVLRKDSARSSSVVEEKVHHHFSNSKYLSGDS
jgi:hypothetical protein